MKKKSPSESGFFNPRIFFAFTLCAVAACLGMFSFAATSPSSGVLSTSNRSISFSDSVGAPPNPTGFALGNPNCGPSNSLCSVFTLQIDPSVGADAGSYHFNDYQITVQWSWAVTTVDYDVFIKNAAGALVAKNQSTADPSTIILPTNLPAGNYTLIVVLSTGAPVPYTATVNLEPRAQGPGLCNPQVANCTPPRFENYPAGPGQSDDAGEPSIGVDWNPNVAGLQHDKVNTGGVAFFTSSNHEWRVDFDDCSSPAIYSWNDVSSLFDQQFVLTDPIGWVDHTSDVELGLTYPPPHTPGRVFAMDLIGGEGQSFSAYSDDDGANYLPGGNGGPGQGPDHETLGGGPYFGTPPPTASYPASGAKHAIYYCSQDIVAEAQCSRSDDGGQTFGPAVPLYSPTQCTGGIHGHVKVARDGTAYVPNSSCGTVGTAGVAVSTDNGMTWTERNITNSTSSQDPSLGIGMNNVGKAAGQTTPTIYLGYTDGDNHAKVAFSHDRGTTWSLPVDVGAPFGVTHAVFPVVVAGDDNRASFGFLGTGDGIPTTGTCDPYGATLNCKNIWHLYIATTYDGGQNWITVDATPNDPVQTGTICLQGTTCAGGRNLLDFNDMTVDSQGRILIGYADGCVNCANTFSAQSSSDHGTVTRQSGGRRLFQAFDPQEPFVPAPPHLVSATTQSGGALITWLEPDNGGSPITGYRVYRGTSSGNETFLASVSGDTTTKYFDPAPPAGPVFYYVTAVNGVSAAPYGLPGESDHCRELSLGGGVAVGDSCTFPYVNVVAAGTNSTAATSSQKIQYINVGEPFTDCSDNSLTFVFKVPTLDPTGTGTPVLPPNTEWEILFGVTDTNGNPKTIYVSMDTDCPFGNSKLPTFTYGRRDPSATGGTFDQGECSSQPGNPAFTCPQISGSYTADGTITIKLNVSAPLTFSANTGAANATEGAAFAWDGHATGTQLKNVTGSITLFAGCAAGFLESLSDSAGSTYTRQGNNKCASSLPVARLTATPMSGAAPLQVSFDASTSSDPNACIAVNSFTLDFGDGSAPVTQTSPAFSHTYSSPGDYPARLTVKDANNHISTNAAQVVISVTGSTPPLGGVVSRKTHGAGAAAKDFDIVLPATGSPAVECRSGGAAGNYQMVFVFQNALSNVTSVSASSSQTVGGASQPVSASGSPGATADQYVVNLTGVPNAQYVTVTLHGVTDSASNVGDVSATMGVLIGDVNGTRLVDTNDVSAVQSKTRQTVTTANFKLDVNTTGLIDTNDVSVTQSHTRTNLH